MKVKFFAQLRELLSCDELEISAPYPPTMEALKLELMKRGDNWQDAFASNILMAKNQVLCDGDTAIAAGDEIAFFPPVTGG